MGVAYYKQVHNFQMDSQTCTRFSGKVGSWAKVRQKKGGVGVGMACNKKANNFQTYSCHLAKVCGNAHKPTNHIVIGHSLPCPYTAAPPPSITHQPFVADCWLQLLQICFCCYGIPRQMIVTYCYWMFALLAWMHFFTCMYSYILSLFMFLL